MHGKAVPQLFSRLFSARRSQNWGNNTESAPRNLSFITSGNDWSNLGTFNELKMCWRILLVNFIETNNNWQCTKVLSSHILKTHKKILTASLKKTGIVSNERRRIDKGLFGAYPEILIFLNSMIFSTLRVYIFYGIHQDLFIFGFLSGLWPKHGSRGWFGETFGFSAFDRKSACFAKIGSRIHVWTNVRPRKTPQMTKL